MERPRGRKGHGDLRDEMATATERATGPKGPRGQKGQGAFKPPLHPYYSISLRRRQENGDVEKGGSQDLGPPLFDLRPFLGPPLFDLSPVEKGGPRFWDPPFSTRRCSI